MSWQCPKCHSINANVVENCCYCSQRIGVNSYRPALNSEQLSFDLYDCDLLKVEIYQLKKAEYLHGINLMPMTEQEELFAKFFNHESILVKDMDDMALRSHREELSRIAFEARARLTAISQETQERTAKGKRFKAENTEADGLVSDAINTIKSREKKLSKQEKLIEGLMKLPGITRAQAEAMVNKTTVPVQVKTEVHKAEVSEMKAENNKPTPIVIENKSSLEIAVEDKPTTPMKPLFSGLGLKKND